LYLPQFAKLFKVCRHFLGGSMKYWNSKLRQRGRFWPLLGALILWPGLCHSADSQNPEPHMSFQVAEPKSNGVLTLDTALQMALDNNPNIVQARQRINAQQAVWRQQMSAYYPSINLNNYYRTGTEVNTTSSVSTTGAFDTYSSQTAANMILYNFGKREGTVQAARETVDATAFNYTATVNSIVLSVKQAYYGYLQAKAIVKVNADTVDERQLVVNQTQGFFDVGTRARIDVVRAQANLYSAQADLITAQNAMQVAWVVLKNAIGVRDLPEQPLVEDISTPAIAPPFGLNEAREIAYANRPELKSFDAQKRAQDQVIATARRGHLPDIIFDGNYRWANVGNNTATVRGHTFRLDIWPLKPGWQVQVSLNIPLFDGFRTTNRVQESLSTYYVISAQAEQQRQQVALDVESSYLNLLAISERLKANRAAADAAKENLDLASGRYQVGVGSIIELTDAQNLYTTSETTFVRTVYDYRIAEAFFQRAIGR
jgi:outer membrane protein TolC